MSGSEGRVRAVPTGIVDLSLLEQGSHHRAWGHGVWGSAALRSHALCRGRAEWGCGGQGGHIPGQMGGEAGAGVGPRKRREGAESGELFLGKSGQDLGGEGVKDSRYLE